MGPPDKPHWFRWTHVAFGTIPLVSAAATVAVLVSDELTNSAGKVIDGLAPRLFMIGLTLVFVSFFLALLWRDKRNHDRYTYLEGSFFALMVDPGKYRLNEMALLDSAYETATRWREVLDASKVHKLFSKHVIWVTFKPEPLMLRGTPVAGYATPRAKIFVRYRSEVQPLRRTAFEHELGHVIQGNVTGSWSQGDHHQRAKDNGLR